MKLYYLFLFFCLFTQTREAELLMSCTEIGMVQYGHGSVEVMQGRHHINVGVKCEGRFVVQLIRVSDGVEVAVRGGVSEGKFRFDQSSFPAGLYDVCVVFIDEAFRVERVRLEVKE